MAAELKTETPRRNARSHEAILDATMKLLGSSGYIDFSIEKVASEAGVGKQTIYRWWSSRADLVLEVWRDRILPPLPVYDDTLNGWSILNTGETQIPDNVTLGMLNVSYSAAGKAAYDKLDTNHSWTIIGAEYAVSQAEMANAAVSTALARLGTPSERHSDDPVNWDVSLITDATDSFKDLTTFDSDISQWDISSLTSAANMLDGSGMSQANFDALLRGWSTIQPGNGETHIHSGVTLGAAGIDYSEATSLLHLQDAYGWTIDATLAATRADGKQLFVDAAGNHLIRDDNLEAEGFVYHLLDGDDDLVAGSGDDEIYGGTGDDTLDGGTGADTFVYLYNTAGTDTINNFVLEEDKIDLSNLLMAFDETSDVNDYISASATEMADTYHLSIDHDLDLLTAQVQIQLVVTGTTAEAVVDALNDAGSLELV